MALSRFSSSFSSCFVTLRAWAPNTFLLVRCAFLAVLISLSIAVLGTAVELLEIMPFLPTPSASQVHEALSWSIATGVMMSLCILASAFPAVFPEYFALPVYFELCWTVLLAILHTISAFMINRQMASYCMPSWTEDHPEAGYLCSGFDSLSPVLIILVACTFLYAGILSFVTYTHTDRVPKSCGSCILTADLYNIPWFSNNTITTTTHNSNNKNISTFPTNLEKRNIHGLVISKPEPWAPTSPNPDLEAAHCATSHFDDRRSRAASGIWSDWDDVDLGQPTRAHAYNIQHSYAASMIERSTTYSGKIPQTGYETDRRATWARRLAASVVRGRSNPFPAVPHQQDVAGLQSPAPVLASPHAHRKSLSTQVYSLTLGEGISVSGPKDVLAHSGLGHYRHDSDATAYEHELARPGAPLPGDQAKALPPIPAFRVENRTSREPSWFSDDPSTRWSRSSFPRSDFGHGFGRDVELGLGNTQEAKAEWLAVNRFSGHSDKSEKLGKLSWMGHISRSSSGSMSSLGKSLQRTEGGLWVSLNSK